jgi:hypothetical protein
VAGAGLAPAHGAGAGHLAVDALRKPHADRVRGARRATPAELAWIALLPTVAAMLVVIVALGPPLGHLLVRPEADGLWPSGWWMAQGEPKPVDLGRYVIALLAPLALLATVAWGTRRQLELEPRTIRAIALAGQSLLLVAVLVAVSVQGDIVLGDATWMLPSLFSPRVVALAALLAVVAVAALRRPQAPERVARFARDTTVRRVVCLVAACAVAGLLMLEAVSTDRLSEDNGTMNWTLNDAFAVLNGRTPLVDFHVFYGKLVPYGAAVVLRLLGMTALVYTSLMAVLSALALVAVYAVFRRIVHSPALALVLFVPFAALSCVGHSPVLPSVWPMRYGGAYLLAWLTARHVGGAGPRRVWVLFAVAGLVAVNNLEFGAGAVLATLVALLVAVPPTTARAARRLAAGVAGGLLAAFAAFSLLTLARAGALPSLAVLTEFPRMFNDLGWFAVPMPAVGLHLAIYATLVAAIVVGGVRIVRRAQDRLLTAMLLWAGVFGLLAGTYFVGRADGSRLASMFSAWAFALMLLTIVVARALAARRWRAIEVSLALVLLGFALAVCAIGEVVSPSDNVRRLTASVRDPTYRAAAERFVDARTRPGETVVILLPEGHRIAYELGLRNVSPYGLQNQIVTRGQMRTVIETARRERARQIFVPATDSYVGGEGDTTTDQLLMYAQAGFDTRSSTTRFLELSSASDR